MKNQQKKSELTDRAIISIGIACFKYSLAIGITLTLSFIATKSNFLVDIGCAYLMVAFIINSLILFVLLFSSYTHANAIEKIKVIGLMLLNIPIAFACILIIIKFI